MDAEYTNTLMNINFDVDIDMADRAVLLEHLDYVNARAEGQKRKLHPSGIYLQPIPFDPFYNVSTIDHVDAQEMGYFKIDILNNSIYEKVKDEEHLAKLMEEPMWELLEHKEVVENLPHVNMHLSLLQIYKPRSVEDLAIVLALIRPAKKHLIPKPIVEIKEQIWEKPSNGEYYYKKSHAVAYAVSIIVALNLYVENLVCSFN